MKRSVTALVLTVALIAAFWGDAPPAKAAPSLPTPTLTIVSQTLSTLDATDTVSVSGSGFPRNQAVKITVWACNNAGTTCVPSSNVNFTNPWIVQSGTGAFTSQRAIPCSDLLQKVALDIFGQPILATHVRLEAEDWDVRKNLPSARPKFSRVSSTPATHVCPQPQP